MTLKQITEEAVAEHLARMSCPKHTNSKGPLTCDSCIVFQWSKSHLTKHIQIAHEAGIKSAHDAIREDFEKVWRLQNDSSTKEPLPCSHGRPSGTSCPHCLGLNNSPTI